MLIAIGQALLMASLVLTILVSVREARKIHRSKIERIVDATIALIAVGNLLVLIAAVVLV